MNHQVEAVGAVTVLTLQDSHLDAGNAAAFKTIVSDIMDASPRLILDLNQVQFLDSSGCGAILTAIRWLDRVGGRLKVCGLTQPVRDIFALFQMLRILDVYETRNEALRAFAQEPSLV